VCARVRACYLHLIKSETLECRYRVPAVQGLSAAVVHRCHEAHEGTENPGVCNGYLLQTGGSCGGRRVRRSAAPNLALLVAHVGADLRHVEVFVSVQNVVVM
jgi:hypothetical protein